MKRRAPVVSSGSATPEPGPPTHPGGRCRSAAGASPSGGALQPADRAGRLPGRPAIQRRRDAFRRLASPESCRRPPIPAVGPDPLGNPAAAATESRAARCVRISGEGGLVRGRGVVVAVARRRSAVSRGDRCSRVRAGRAEGVRPGSSPKPVESRAAAWEVRPAWQDRSAAPQECLRRRRGRCSAQVGGEREEEREGERVMPWTERCGRGCRGTARSPSFAGCPRLDERNLHIGSKEIPRSVEPGAMGRGTRDAASVQSMPLWYLSACSPQRRRPQRLRLAAKGFRHRATGGETTSGRPWIPLPPRLA